MLVGLRGFSTYQTVMKGTVGSEPTKRDDGEVAFYEAFADEAKAE